MSATLPGRTDFASLQPVASRWQDADAHGQIANLGHYSLFETAVLRYLIEAGGLDLHDGEAVPFVVSSGCDFFASAAFPDVLEVGLSVSQLGASSVRWRLALFRAGEEEPCSVGYLVQVFVERLSQQPLSLEGRLLAALEALRRD